MVNLKDSIRYQNVVSKVYDVDYKAVADCIKEFSEVLQRCGVKKRGEIFYSYNGFMEDGSVELEVFAPLFSSKVVPNGMNFHSYYSVEHMASARVASNLEKNTMPILEMVIKTINTVGGEISSPFYFIKDEVLGQPYITIKIGYKTNTEISDNVFDS